MELAEILEKADFEKGEGLIPAVIQDDVTRRVLMLAYMNKEAITQTFKQKKVTFFSRTKKKIWVKGETSGNFLEFISASLDCDNDTLLVKVHPLGPACHTGSDTCWNEKNTNSRSFMYKLEKVINRRLVDPVLGSYTNKLFSQGINKIAKKVGEEAIEVVIEAKDNNDKLFVSEMADLMYHLTVLLVKKKISWKEVEKALDKRSK